MVATDENGTMKSVRKLDDKLVALSKLSLHEGAKVAIIAGDHQGLVATVRQMEKSRDSIVVRLEKSEVDVVVSKSDVEMFRKNQEKTEKIKVFVVSCFFSYNF
jgi:predicted DNA-binding antitoxin AbrB/MazE fold protein